MHAHQLPTGSDARTFALAGNAYFTLVSKATGARFTYRVSKKQGAAASDPYFVSVFATARVQTGGGSFGRVYGNVVAKEPKFVHGKKSQIGEQAPSARAFAWAWAGAGTLPALSTRSSTSRTGARHTSSTVLASLER